MYYTFRFYGSNCNIITCSFQNVDSLNSDVPQANVSDWNCCVMDILTVWITLTRPTSVVG